MAESVAKLLLAAAREDAKTLHALGPLTDIADAIPGFHAQQAVEKALRPSCPHETLRFAGRTTSGAARPLVGPGLARATICRFARRTQSVCRGSTLRTRRAPAHWTGRRRAVASTTYSNRLHARSRRDKWFVSLALQVRSGHGGSTHTDQAPLSWQRGQCRKPDLTLGNLYLRVHSLPPPH